MMQGGSQSAPEGTSPEDNKINYSLALGGLFRSALFFASKIRLNQRLIENAGNRETGEGGWYYRNVPVTFDDFIGNYEMARSFMSGKKVFRSPEDTRNNYYLLREVFKQLNNTWNRNQYTRAVEIIFEAGNFTMLSVPFENFILGLISSGIMRNEQFNNIIRTFFVENAPPGDPRPEGITQLRNLFGTNPVEQETKNWLSYIIKNWTSYEYTIFSQGFIFNELDFKDTVTAEAVLNYLADIIMFNPESFRGNVLEQLIFLSIRSPFNIFKVSMELSNKAMSYIVIIYIIIDYFVAYFS
jgi:hypothetical protein